MCPNLPDHLFVASNGDLHDTRKENWAETPLRAGYSYTCECLVNNNELKAALRNGPYAWPGGYQMYMVDANGMPMSFEGAEKEFLRFRGAEHTFEFPIYVSVNWENDELYCDITGERIPSCY